VRQHRDASFGHEGSIPSRPLWQNDNVPTDSAMSRFARLRRLYAEAHAMNDTETFEAHRSTLLALAYRMLGDVARAEDVVQEAWMRWQRRQVSVDAPKAFLITTVTRLCLDELGSARARREDSRSDRLPEPIDLDDAGLGRIEMLDQVSMAFLVVLQRLTPA